MKLLRPQTALIALLLLVAAPAARLSAHCDTLDGPVIVDARAALAQGDVTAVLKWIGPHDEDEIRHAFAEALAVRKLSAEAAALADRWFFENLVRVHRAGENAPYTGLHHEAATEPGIVAADQAFATGEIAPLLKTASAAVKEGLQRRFERVQATHHHRDDSVEAGRAYVAAYVDFIHFAEALFGQSTPHTTDGHGEHAH